MKEFLFFLLFPIILGGIGGLLSNTKKGYMTINKPTLSPPPIVFPIVWTILYALMGISSYRVNKRGGDLKVYYIQLILNSLWTLIFFNLKQYLLAFIWIIVLIVLVIIMIVQFYKVDKLSAYLQIPYLLWLIFASYLSYSVFILN